MKSLSLIALIAVSFGALTLSGCSGCGSQESAQEEAPPPVYCGRGTVPQGNQCVAR